MRIAQVTLRFDAPGGVETNVREVARRLRERGEDVRIYASDLYDESRWDRRGGYAPVVDGNRVERFPVYKRLIPGVTLPMMTGLIGALARDAPEVIHAHSHRYGHVLESALVARERGIPLVVSTHYHPADRREPAWKRGLLRLQDVGFGATAYRVARALIVESGVERRLVSEFAPTNRIHVVPPGIDLARWANTSVAPLPVGLPEHYVVYAGRVAPNKGLDVLIEALARLPDSARPPLVLVGHDWGERTCLVELATRRGVERSLHWLDHVEEATYRTVLRRASVLVLPSEWEAFGLVLLDAMAAGTAIVATRVGAVPEVLEEGRCGRLVPYGDPDALATALRELLADPEERATLTDAGRVRVAGLDWSVAAARHLEVYRAAAGVA